ncbi:sugar transferase [Antarcticimicrobium luteum]|uniref:Sugar transferase n=1 Tax=Antarcticimicrobium luteum TaxID=2547397 RepID=A0A4V3AQB7_9RHOB|nr:sugar transferase [Antarcticimicrobium luteum]TDK42137.1 sugar transferase [Antarcticimicrobium luteum]
MISAPANLDRPFPGYAEAIASRSTEGWYARAGKRALDIVLVLLTLPLTLPLIALCALALWMEGGQPFYWQDRVGQRGRRFSIAKLRTMVRDADARLAHLLATDPAIRDEWNHAQKLRNDPRITPMGRILRATSFDELPQLWNVLKGEMSLVGPRPMLPEQRRLYGDAAFYEALRPGITGLWQVSMRNDKEFTYRARIDAAYCRSLSLGRDLKLMVRTLAVVARRTGI